MVRLFHPGALFEELTTGRRLSLRASLRLQRRTPRHWSTSRHSAWASSGSATSATATGSSPRVSTHRPGHLARKRACQRTRAEEEEEEKEEEEAEEGTRTTLPLSQCKREKSGAFETSKLLQLALYA